MLYCKKEEDDRDEKGRNDERPDVKPTVVMIVTTRRNHFIVPGACLLLGCSLGILLRFRFLKMPSSKRVKDTKLATESLFYVKQIRLFILFKDMTNDGGNTPK